MGKTRVGSMTGRNGIKSTKLRFNALDDGVQASSTVEIIGRSVAQSGVNKV